jgi:bifunctional DNA-binding transcriptional regulator/antitoxin component of YhaV-PrlF toxin-antitoxin module
MKFHRYHQSPKGKAMTRPSTLSSKYKVSVPKDPCERLGLRPGQKVAFIENAAGVLMVRVPEREELAGMARGANPEGYRDRKDRQ